MKNMKERAIKALERQFKELSNAKRIKILLMLKDEPGMTLSSIAARDGTNIKTMAEHLRRLDIAGIIFKKSNGRCVNHYLSASGYRIVKMIINNNQE